MINKDNDKTQQERDVDQLIEELSALKQQIVSSGDIISPRKDNNSNRLTMDNHRSEILQNNRNEDSNHDDEVKVKYEQIQSFLSNHLINIVRSLMKRR